MRPITVGDKLPDLVSPPITPRQLVQYAGASGDWNEIHYHEPFARAAGFPSVIAHGMLSMAFLGRLCAAWGGPGSVRRLSVRFRAVTFPGDVVTCSGQVVSVHGTKVEVQLSAKKNDGTITLDGTAVLSLPAALTTAAVTAATSGPSAGEPVAS